MATAVVATEEAVVAADGEETDAEVAAAATDGTTAVEAVASSARPTGNPLASFPGTTISKIQRLVVLLLSLKCRKFLALAFFVSRLVVDKFLLRP